MRRLAYVDVEHKSKKASKSQREDITAASTEAVFITGLRSDTQATFLHPKP